MIFEEMQKIWLAEKQETVYIINEEVLKNKIRLKMKSTLRLTNFTELLLIIINFGAAIFILVINLINTKVIIALYLMAGWMILTGLFVLIKRIRRINSNPVFDRNINDELQHAINTATYQVRLSQSMKWGVIPIAVCCFFVLLDKAQTYWFAAGSIVFFAFAFWMSTLEHQVYVRKKTELEKLRKSLE